MKTYPWTKLPQNGLNQIWGKKTRNLHINWRRCTWTNLKSTGVFFVFHPPPTIKKKAAGGWTPWRWFFFSICAEIECLNFFLSDGRRFVTWLALKNCLPTLQCFHGCKQNFSLLIQWMRSIVIESRNCSIFAKRKQASDSLAHWPSESLAQNRWVEMSLNRPEFIRPFRHAGMQQ